MKTAVLSTLCAFGVVAMTSGCSKDFSKLNSFNETTLTATGPSSSAGGVWEDFEGALVSPWGGSDIWTNTSSLVYDVQSSTVSHSGTSSWWLKGRIKPSATWGPWAGLSGSSLSPTGAGFAGAVKFEMWYKVDKNMSFWLHWNEGTTKGADGEDWATQVNLVADPGWQLLSLPLSAFTDTSAGNGIPDPQDVDHIWLDWSTSPMVSFPLANLYIDDVAFMP